MRNGIDSLSYQLEKLLKDNESKIAAEAVKSAREALDEAKAKMNSEDLSELKGVHERLTNVSHQISSELYKQAGTQGAAGPTQPGEDPGATKKDGDDVIDAEYKDVN
jgi:molecular chaperone DnaK